MTLTLALTVAVDVVTVRRDSLYVASGYPSRSPVFSKPHIIGWWTSCAGQRDMHTHKVKHSEWSIVSHWQSDPDAEPSLHITIVPVCLFPYLCLQPLHSPKPEVA